MPQLDWNRGFGSPAASNQNVSQARAVGVPSSTCWLSSRWQVVLGRVKKIEAQKISLQLESEALAAFVDVNDDILTQAADQAFVPREPLGL